MKSFDEALSIYDEVLDSQFDGVPKNVITRTVGNQMSDEIKSLSFCVLAAEPKMPYGPVDHTAHIFMDLIALAAVNHDESTFWNLRLETFDVQKKEYPTNWNAYDGFLLPGSFSAAYDKDEWIQEFKKRIQDEIVLKERPAFGICFGHQILAHSFDDGNVIATPTGARAGRFEMQWTEEGKHLFGNQPLNLYYTHGDCVEKLPACARALGGNTQVPIQAAAYYGNQKSTPYAITFQAHPEFASSKDFGLFRTLGLIMDAMEARNAINTETKTKQWSDASESYDAVQQDSLKLVSAAFRSLGWFQ